MQARRLFLWAGVAAPLLCYGAFLAASLAYPEMRHAKQYVSELGGPQAAHPFIFNLGVGLGGAAGVLAGRGFFLALRALGGGLFPAGLTAILAAVGGGAIIVSGLFPWPDPRHQWVNLGLAIQFAPLAVVWGLSKRRDFLGLKLFLVGSFVLMGVIGAITRHVILPDLCDWDNVGWWERSYAFVLMAWIGVAAWAFDRRLARGEPDGGSAAEPAALPAE
ncbi:MAG: DUF998 domain-containing protein [Caulobacteraceae bacterium]|nr:DUF998 domain-containing protein [Caulobacteraceae bacterium]